jgi:tRNA threonylcarbamoyladenosine biosynthesis protein TsaE
MRFTLENIDEAAAYILQHVQGNCIALFGPMGAGKTTLTASICKALNVKDAVSSPTFSIVNEYSGVWNQQAVKIAHMDWYRLPDAESLFDAGIADYFDQTQVLCIIEWPERAPELLPTNACEVTLQLLSENERQVIVNAVA